MTATWKRRIERAEWMAGIVLTILALYLHVRLLTHAGPLWRDEANTVAVATRTSLGAMARALEHESFPILPFLLTRVWSALGVGASDFGLRALGFVVGSGILAALWLAYPLLRPGVPLLSLSLFGLNPVVIRWGDSLRGYGMGTLLFLLLFGAVFRACQRLDRPRVLQAAVLAIFAVQCMYQNAILFLAVAAGAALAAPPTLRREVLTSVAGIGALAALSLLPYSGVIARARDHFTVITEPRDPNRIWGVLLEALGSASPGMNRAGEFVSIVWLVLYAAGVLGGILLVLQARRSTVRGANPSTYGLSVLLAGPAAFLVFLLALSFRTQPWYFIVLLGAVAISLDVIWGNLAHRAPSRLARIVVAFVVAAVSVPPVSRLVAMRQTNVDVIARELEARAAPEDLILVDPWFYGVSFHRYYQGRTPWLTVPPLADNEIHRFDLFKEQMKQTDPLRTVKRRIVSTLRSGHAVWVVGLLQRFEAGGTEVAVPVGAPVSSYEELRLFRIDGRVGSR